MLEWKSFKSFPKRERVLVCYINLWGYNHVTEAYQDSDEEYPVTVNGAVLKVPFVWTEMIEGPNLCDFYRTVIEEITNENQGI